MNYDLDACLNYFLVLSRIPNANPVYETIVFPSASDPTQPLHEMVYMTRTLAFSSPFGSNRPPKIKVQ